MAPPRNEDAELLLTLVGEPTPSDDPMQRALDTVHHQHARFIGALLEHSPSSAPLRRVLEPSVAGVLTKRAAALNLVRSFGILEMEVLIATLASHGDMRDVLEKDDYRSDPVAVRILQFLRWARASCDATVRGQCIAGLAAPLRLEPTRRGEEMVDKFRQSSRLPPPSAFPEAVLREHARQAMHFFEQCHY